jgi:putative YhbY family RNA-binding protein
MTILEIDSSTRSELRSQAHSLSPTVMIGADGLTPGVIKEADLALHSHQLIKIRVLGDDREARLAIYDQVCDQLEAAKVQHIGKLLVIYRPQILTNEELKNLQSKSSNHKRNDEGFGAPRTVMVKKYTRNPQKRPKPVATRVLGNERVAAGGQLKRAKARQTSIKKRSLG